MELKITNYTFDKIIKNSEKLSKVEITYSPVVENTISEFYKKNSDVEFNIKIESSAREEWKKIPTTYYSGRQSFVLYDVNKFLQPTILQSVPLDWKQNYIGIKLQISYKNAEGNVIKFNENNVEGRVKGFGSFKPYNRKIPLRIRSSSDVDGLFLTKDITLNNMAQSPSKISEYVIYKIFNDYKMPAPRANFVRLFINDSTVKINEIQDNLITTTDNHYLFEDMRIKFVSLDGISEDQIFYVIERTDTTFKVSDAAGGVEYNLPNFSGDLEFFIDYGEYINVENTRNQYRLNELFGVNNTSHLYEVNVTTSGQELIAQSYAYDVDYGDNNRNDLSNFLQKLDSSLNWYENIQTCVDIEQFIKFSVIELYCGQPDGYCMFLNNSQLHSDSNGKFRLIPWGSDTYFTDGGLLMYITPWSRWLQKCWAYKETVDIFKTELLNFHYWLQNNSRIKTYIDRIFDEKIQDFESDKKRPESETIQQITQAKNDILNFIESRQIAVDSFLSRPYPPSNFNCTLDNDVIVMSWDHVSKSINGDVISDVVYNIYAGGENDLKSFFGPITFSEIGSSDISSNSASLYVNVNFNNTVGFSVAAVHNGVVGLFSEISVINPPPPPPPPPPVPLIRITEVMSNSGSSGTGDWFELKNFGNIATNITGWKMDDSSGNFDYAVPLSQYDGWTSIQPEEVVVFIELSGSTNSSGIFIPSPSIATQVSNFCNYWNIGPGVNNIRNVKIGTYGGNGIGLGSGGDGVVIFNDSGVEVTRVSFGNATSTVGKSFNWIYNSGGNVTSSSAISQLGVGGAYQRNTNIASPGIA